MHSHPDWFEKEFEEERKRVKAEVEIWKEIRSNLQVVIEPCTQEFHLAVPHGHDGRLGEGGAGQVGVGGQTM